MTDMKIFALNDCDWWIGESLEACIADYRKNYTCDPDSVDDDAHELTDEELDKLTFVNTDDDEMWEERSFREQLAVEIAKGGVFPRMFASTEY